MAIKKYNNPLRFEYCSACILPLNPIPSTVRYVLGYIENGKYKLLTNCNDPAQIVGLIQIMKLAAENGLESK